MIYLAKILQIANQIQNSIRTKYDATEAFHILFRFYYPCMYEDLIPRFGRSSLISNHMLNLSMIIFGTNLVK